jgi:D-galactonate transporter
MSNPVRTDEDSAGAPEKRKEADLERTVMWKVTIRLIPFLFVQYVVAYLDRINLSFAALPMKKELPWLTDTAFGLAGGIFFIGYFLFEIPSNLILERTGARVWIARIMITWGVISAAMMFVNAVDGPWLFYLLRFLLGLAEAGFFPGMILYLTYWFPAAVRARAVSRFMTATAMAGVLGALFSRAILRMDGLAGLNGWQWLFLLEGIPSVIVGVLVFLFMTDRPEKASWLTSDEKNWLIDRLRREQEHREKHHRFSLFQALSNGRVWLLTVPYFALAMTSYGFQQWLPLILQASSGFDDDQVILLTAIPYAVAAISMVIWGHHSDHTKERRLHTAIPALAAAGGLAVLSVFLHSWLLTLLASCLVAFGLWCMLGPFWALPTAFLSGTAAAGGIALINSVGNLGGFAGPYSVGRLKDMTQSFVPGLVILAGMMAIGAIVVLLFRHDRRLEHHETQESN